MHLLNEERVVSEIAHSPFGITHELAMPGGEVSLPFQAERCLHVVRIPSFLDGAFIFEIVNVETDVIDDIVTGIGEIGGIVLRPPPRTPVVLEVGRVSPEYPNDTPEGRDVVGLLAFGEPRHGIKIHFPAKTDDRPRLRLGNRHGGGFKFGVMRAARHLRQAGAFHRQRNGPDDVSLRIEFFPDARHPAQSKIIVPGGLSIEVNAQHRRRLLLQPFFPGLQRDLATDRPPVNERAGEF